MNPARTPTATRRVPLAELTAGLLELAAGQVGPAAGRLEVPEVDVCGTLEVSDVTLDSRSVSPGSLFLACHGRGHHGAEFTGEAVARGARGVLYEPSPGALDRVQAGV